MDLFWKSWKIVLKWVVCIGGIRFGFFNYGGMLCLELFRWVVDNVSDFEL